MLEKEVSTISRLGNSLHGRGVTISLSWLLDAFDSLIAVVSMTLMDFSEWF